MPPRRHRCWRLAPACRHRAAAQHAPILHSGFDWQRSAEDLRWRVLEAASQPRTQGCALLRTLATGARFANEHTCAVLVPHAHRCPVLATLHGDGGGLADSIAAQTLRAANRVVACSGAILERGLEVEPSIASRSSVICNGIDVCAIATVAPVLEPRLLYVGRLAEEKGADIAIDAFAPAEAASALRDRAAIARHVLTPSLAFLAWATKPRSPKLGVVHRELFRVARYVGRRALRSAANDGLPSEARQG